MRFPHFIKLRTLPASQLRMTMATWVTLSRIILTPFIVWALLANYWITAIFLFSCAALSDMLDGFLARIRKEQTTLGASLDPIADKILLLASLTTLASIHTEHLHIPWWFVVCIAARELIVIGGTIVIYLVRGLVYVNPTFTSKITTLVQSLLVVWLCICYFFHWVPVRTYYISLAGVMGLVLISLVQYVRIGIGLIYGNGRSAA